MRRSERRHTVFTAITPVDEITNTEGRIGSWSIVAARVSLFALVLSAAAGRADARDFVSTLPRPDSTGAPRPRQPERDTAVIKERGPCDSTAQAERQIVVTMSHRNLRSTGFCTLRLSARRTVLVHITDANPLIYSYSMTGTALAADPAPAAFRTLLGVRAIQLAVREAEVHYQPPELSDADRLELFAHSVISLGDELLDLVATSDWTSNEDAAEVERKVQNAVESAVARRGLGAAIGSEERLRARLDALLNAIPKANLTDELTSLHAAAREAAPAVVTLTRQLRSLSLGHAWVPYQYAGSGDVILEINITNRLGDAYTRRRATGEELDVATVSFRRPSSRCSGRSGHRG